MTLSQADHSTSPPRVDIPRQYNTARCDLLARNAQRAAKPAFIDASTGAQLTYGELTAQAHRFANALRARGMPPEARVMIAMLDTPEWPVVFLGCMLAGVVPVAAEHPADRRGLSSCCAIHARRCCLCRSRCGLPSSRSQAPCPTSNRWCTPARRGPTA